MQLLLLLVPLSLFALCATNNETAVRSAVLSAIWKAVQLFKNEYKEFNLDGVLGFRMLLEQIKGTLERCDAKKKLYDCKLMERMKTELSEILNKIPDFVQKKDPEYFENFVDVIGDKFWILPTSWNQTTPDLVYRGSLPDKSLCLTLQNSDKCIKSLLGSRSKNKEPCVVTASCLKQMNQHGCQDYSLSHQLFFHIIGKMKGCNNDAFGKDFGHHTNIYCANMMEISKQIELNGYAVHQQDLFMENILMCGLCGYSDFYKPEWMNKIISWQIPNIGCFGDTGRDLKSEKAASENHYPKRVKRTMRQFLGDVCESHMTAMAVGSLGGFLYFSFM